MRTLDPETVLRDAQRAAPACDYWSIRLLCETTETISVRQDIVQAPSWRTDHGFMVAVGQAGGFGFAASSDVSPAGIGQAFADAAAMADMVARRMVFDPRCLGLPASAGQYASPRGDELPAGLDARIDIAREACQSAGSDDRVRDWFATLASTSSSQWFLTGDGSPAAQQFRFVVPSLGATARHNGQTQTRTLAGQYNGYCQQGGAEIIAHSGFLTRGEQVAEQAVELTLAPNCPDGTMDVLLMPDQMMLQIHESIGHPLELDRILGDERNFAGTSFVTLDMFGHYQYGSELLNVSHNPDITEQFASFAIDDDGTASERVMLISRGILQRPLGGHISARRAEAAGYRFAPVATSRACSWNRAPIDRMSNLNIEPGDTSLDDMIASVDNGVLMQTNCSWSIDDARNKFQFGCEYGRLIRNGKLGAVVRNPNYRGVSASFWRNLKMVGDPSTVQVMGTPYCGKGEPMQVIRVGHASPACLFGHVDVFGADA